MHIVAACKFPNSIEVRSINRRRRHHSKVVKFIARPVNTELGSASFDDEANPG